MTENVVKISCHVVTENETPLLYDSDSDLDIVLLVYALVAAIKSAEHRRRFFVAEVSTAYLHDQLHFQF